MQTTTMISLQSSKVHVSSSSGFALAAFVRDQCNALKKPYKYEFAIPFWIQRMHVLPGNKTLYCPVEKVATTFWRRVIYQANHRSVIRHPYQVSIYMALSQNFHYPDKEQSAETLKSDFKFFFVRNPFHRILSAYIDKIFVPNPQFWDQFGRHSIQMFRKNDSRLCYHDATFSEFVQFVVWSVGHLKNIDPHFLPATEMCVPCTMDYSFIGKMESFSDDIYPVLEKIQLGTAIPVLKEDLNEFSNIDALQDSIFSPYGWKLEILQCMSWYEALRRVWRKLQMRGLIDVDHKFLLDKKAAEKLSKENFLEIAKRAWKESDVNKLKKQKIDVFIEMYRSVPINVLKKFVTAYKIDFHLYNYDPSPQEIFNRTLSYTRHNFADFRN
ncbi:carbohydrate sulfotransferase 12-like [Mercenaria mercenaria]|uniref:carbohydrate sulfotransferase 12-like n=1 Tax=Mercenaria mercenaria TaxID=6596 RepID=UPI00234F755F|nr:carbohydrate sulfotransferase 12-like [Mercenaria mercenaria]